MQIHELNNFTGTLGAGAYLAVDDGNDTGKLSTQQLLAATEARIDNIIAGPAPSAEEIVDARRGADGVTYNSLGTAIRTQVGDLKSALNNLADGIVTVPYTQILNKGFNRNDGTFPDEADWDITDFIPVVGGETMWVDNPIYQSDYNGWYTEDKAYINWFSVPAGTDIALDVPKAAGYVVLTNSHARFAYKVRQNAHGLATKYDISAVVTDLDGFKDDLTLPSENIWNAEWEKGALGWGDGANTPSDTVMRTKDFISVNPSTQYAFYDGRDWTEAQYNVSYPIQFVFEYDIDGIFLRSQTLYWQSFTTGADTHKVRFRSTTIPTTFDISVFNTKKFLLSKGTAYRQYISPSLKARDVEHPINGHQSSNLFNGIMGEFVRTEDGIVNVISSSVRATTDWIKISKNDYSSVFWMIRNYDAEKLQLRRMICYDANKCFISTIDADVVRTSVYGAVCSANLPDNTEYIILSSVELSNTQENVASVNALKTACESGALFVATSLSDIDSNKWIDASNKVSMFDTDIGFLEDVRNDNIRSFMKNALDSYSDDLLSHNYDVVFSAMTDIHSFSPEPFAILNYMANSGAVNFAINLGDNIPDKFALKTDAVNFQRTMYKAQNRLTTKAPIYNAVGNHDINPTNTDNISDGTNMIMIDELYSLMMERTRKGIASGKCYGYFDIDNAKVRVIILNTSDIFDSDGTPLVGGNNTAIQQEQFTWFCQTALDFSNKADKSDWAVITMSHDRATLASGYAFEPVIEAFTTGTFAIATGTRTLDGYTFNISETVDFTEQGAIEYIGHICGHAHEDAIYPCASDYKEVQIACAVLNAYYYDGNNSRQKYTRIAGTTDELLFDTICINRATRTVDLKRFGVGSDRRFSY